MDMLSRESGLDLTDDAWTIYARALPDPAAYLGVNSVVHHSALNRGCDIDGRVENSVLSAGVVVEEGAEVHYSVLLPGAVVKAGAVVKYAIVGENCTIGAGATVGAFPEDTMEAWGLTVLAPYLDLPDGSVVSAGKMLDKDGQEVAR